MAPSVGSLESLDLLDLLFDHQDGILRGLDLGTPPAVWPQDRVRAPGLEPAPPRPCWVTALECHTWDVTPR